MTNKLLIICGPTATGKTALALQLAKQFNGELASADSRQIYRGMDIGTGKDLPIQVQISGHKLQIKFKDKKYKLKTYLINDVPVWMYDVVNPDEEFSVAHYQSLAGAVIEDIWSRGKLPIVVGGTGLYLKALIEPIDTISIPPNLGLRKRLTILTVHELQTELEKISPQVWLALNQSDRQNSRRLIRKIEITQYLENESIGKQEPNFPKSDNLIIGLTAPFKELYQRIDARVEARVSAGILAEIQQLLNRGYDWKLPALNSLGYKEWEKYDNTNLEQIIERWKFNEHGYSRRQFTWFKRQPGINWFDITEPRYLAKIARLVRGWYTK